MFNKLHSNSHNHNIHELLEISAWKWLLLMLMWNLFWFWESSLFSNRLYHKRLISTVHNIGQAFFVCFWWTRLSKDILPLWANDILPQQANNILTQQAPPWPTCLYSNDPFTLVIFAAISSTILRHVNYLWLTLWFQLLVNLHAVKSHLKLQQTSPLK